MSFRLSMLVVSFAALAGLTACSGKPVNPDIEWGAQYWQRISVSDAAYMQGPKAQQMLNKDIAGCVVELRELEHLSGLRNPLQLDTTGRTMDPDDIAMREWDNPSHDEYFLAEHEDYHDFEGCMLTKGWERIIHVPYDVSEKAKETYVRARTDDKYKRLYTPTYSKRYKPSDAEVHQDFSNINE